MFVKLFGGERLTPTQKKKREEKRGTLKRLGNRLNRLVKLLESLQVKYPPEAPKEKLVKSKLWLVRNEIRNCKRTIQKYQRL